MPGGVVIVIPSQGDAKNAFEDSANTLNKKLYSGKATIVKTTVTSSGGTTTVTFKTLKGDSFSWNSAHDLSSVLTISHAFAADGPNLAMLDDSVDVEAHQPWGSKDNQGKELTAEGKAFWQSVGKTLTSDGKLILLGCKMGKDQYAGLVAAATGKRVYAATDEIAAGDSDSALRYARSIEEGHPKSPMKKFSP